MPGIMSGLEPRKYADGDIPSVDNELLRVYKSKSNNILVLCKPVSMELETTFLRSNISSLDVFLSGYLLYTVVDFFGNTENIILQSHHFTTNIFIRESNFKDTRILRRIDYIIKCCIFQII